MKEQDLQESAGRGETKGGKKGTAGKARKKEIKRRERRKRIKIRNNTKVLEGATCENRRKARGIRRKRVIGGEGGCNGH